MISAENRSFYRSALRMMLFIAFQNGIVCMVGMVDNIMIGAWSQDALSGVALANQIQFMLQMVISGASQGMGVLCSQYWGLRRVDTIKKIIGLAILFSLLTGLLFFCVMELFPLQILGLLSSDVMAVREGADYIRIVGFSYFFFAVSVVLNEAQRSIEKVKIGILSSIVGVIVNVVLNRVFIFGFGRIPAMGAKGAAIATLIARFAEMAVLIVYTYGIDKYLAVKLQDFVDGIHEYMRDFLKVAMPVVLSGANWGIATSFQTAILGHMGSNAIAANSIATSLFSLISVAAYGMGGASAVLIGKEVGSGDISNLKAHVKGLQVMYLSIGVISGLILFLMCEPVLSFYAISQEAIEVARKFITVLSITLVGTAYQAPCLTGIVRGGGNTGFVFKNDLVFQWLIVIPLSLLSAFVWKLDSVWVFLCLKSDQILKCFVAIPVVNRYHWVKRVTR